MNIKSLNKGADNRLCYSFLLIHNILMSFSTIDVPMWAQAILLGLCVLFFISYLWKKRYVSFIEACFFLVLIIVCLKCYSVSGKMDMLYYIFLLFLLQDCRLEEFLMTDVIIRAVLTGLLFILSNAGIIANNIYITADLPRYGCGFNNPNSFGYMVFLIYLEILVLLEMKKRSGFLQILCPCILFCILVWNFSMTRTAVVLMFCTAVIFILHHYVVFPKPRAILLIPPILTNILIYGYQAYIPFVLQINQLMTGRIRFFNSFIMRYSPTLYGNEVTYISSAMAKAQGVSAVICDNLYLFLLCNLGILSAIIWGAGLVLATMKAKETMILFMLMISFYGIAENTMSNPMMFPAIICVANATGDCLRAAERKHCRMPVDYSVELKN